MNGLVLNLLALESAPLNNDLLLQGNDDGFTKAPSKYWEQEIFPKYFNELDTTENKICCKFCGSLNINSKMADQMIIIECSDCGSLSEYTSA